MTAEAAPEHVESDGQLSLLAANRSAPGDVDEGGEHGEVFTRPWVVTLILDLVGYTADRDLSALSVVEPACGSGAFLGQIVERLSASCRRGNRPIDDAAGALRAYDLLPANVALSRKLVVRVLVGDGWPVHTAEMLAERWVHTADYLLRPMQLGAVDLVVGNPPYVRLEDVPDTRMRAYRAACPTMTGRSDLYIGFFEKALHSLKPEGKVGFICADRWMRNQYGRQLRALATDRFSVDSVVTMHDVDAFEEQVSAYPAITVLSRRPQGSAVVVDTNGAFCADDGTAITRFTNSAEPAVSAPAYQAARLPHWFGGDESWPTGSPARLAMIEHLTDHFPPLEDPATQTKVGIGVATGADGVFITKNAAAVEPERLLPLGMVADIASGKVDWSGHYLVNPWGEDGLVQLPDYPRLFGYFTDNAAALRRRNVAKRSPARWYRTIDRVIPGLAQAAKLYIPDMRREMHPVLDEGHTYPHHNLYFVTSQGWDLRVLGGLLMSAVATAFVEAYCVKMRGGTLRFQAQYLRRIRVPRIADVSVDDAAALAAAFERRDVGAATEVALRLYGLDALPA